MNNDNRENTDRFVSGPDLAKYLGYSESTIRRYRQQGLPCVGKGRLRRYHIASVIQWISEKA